MTLKGIFNMKKIQKSNKDTDTVEFNVYFSNCFTILQKYWIS